MSLSLSIACSQSSNREDFIFTETTGEYSLANTGGWGAPNPEIIDVTLATLSISKRNSDGTYTTPTVVDVLGQLPSVDGISISVSGIDAGFNTVINDGIYKVLYNVEGIQGESAYSTSVTKIFYITGGIECCMQEKAAQYATCNCGCDGINKEFDQIMFGWRMLCSAIDCGNLNQVQLFIDKLTKKCANCGCN